MSCGRIYCGEGSFFILYKSYLLLETKYLITMVPGSNCSTVAILVLVSEAVKLWSGRLQRSLPGPVEDC